MVPVRKPGRPLSSCPHPSSKPCSCGTVTAAIPRKQTCNCGPSETSSTTTQSKAETEDDNGNGTTSPATSPDEPRPLPTPTLSSFRVQKSKGGGASSRKMSIDPANLERMDLSQLNVLPSPSSYGGGSGGGGGSVTMPPASVGMAHAHLPAMSHYPMINLPAAELAYSQQFMLSMLNQMQSPMMGGPVGTPAPTPTLAHAPTPTPTPSAKSQRTPTVGGPPAVGSCCGGGGGAAAATKRESEPEPSDASIIDPHPQTSKQQKSNGGAPKGSCCSSKPMAANDLHLNPGAMTPPEHTYHSPADMVMPYPPGLALPNAMYGLFPQPTVFTYPPQYGTYMQPLQPEQWRQVMASIAFGQMAAQPQQGFDMGTPVPMVGTPGAYAHAAVPGAGTSHRCTCGDGCQCVGCAAHPYNEATQNYVRSAWTALEDPGQVSSPNGGGSHNHSHGHSHSHSHSHAHSHHHNHDHNGHDHHHNGKHTPTNGDHIDEASSTTDPALSINGSNGETNGAVGGSLTAMSHQPEGTSTGPQTPSDTPSSITEEQALSASDFFFVTYPFGDSCAGETASCPCGDDCQCIGCVIHNNPGPE